MNPSELWLVKRPIAFAATLTLGAHAISMRPRGRASCTPFTSIPSAGDAGWADSCSRQAFAGLATLGSTVLLFGCSQPIAKGDASMSGADGTTIGPIKA